MSSNGGTAGTSSHFLYSMSSNGGTAGTSYITCIPCHVMAVQPVRLALLLCACNSIYVYILVRVSVFKYSLFLHEFNI